jgi:formylmethanofuran dehydrogenase subunit B
VDYSHGVPQYTPRDRGLARLTRQVQPANGGGFAAALVVGSTAELAVVAVAALGTLPTVVIGPRASEAAFTPRIAIDTGVGGIHDGGTAYRMDEVPLPLRPPLPGPRTAVETLTTLTRAVVERRRTAARDAAERGAGGGPVDGSAG